MVFPFLIISFTGEVISYSFIVRNWIEFIAYSQITTRFFENKCNFYTEYGAMLATFFFAIYDKAAACRHSGVGKTHVAFYSLVLSPINSVVLVIWDCEFNWSFSWNNSKVACTYSPDHVESGIFGSPRYGGYVTDVTQVLYVS